METMTFYVIASMQGVWFVEPDEPTAPPVVLTLFAGQATTADRATTC